LKVLLSAQVKPTLFNNPPPDHVFGYCLPSDPEGAREGEDLQWPQQQQPASGFDGAASAEPTITLCFAVTMMWKEHSPSPGKNGRPDGSPLPDFTKMNKLAAKRWGELAVAFVCMVSKQAASPQID
jgi:hypothetical protein